MTDIDYSQNTFCRGCNIKYPFGTHICSICKQKVATKPKSKKRILVN